MYAVDDEQILVSSQLLTTSFQYGKLVVTFEGGDNMGISKSDKLTAVALSVFKLNGQLIEWGNHFSRPHGMTSARWQVLGAISQAPQPYSIPQIGAAMGVTRQGVLKQINLLVEEGLVEPQPNPTHSRSPLYVPTTRGKTVFLALQQRWQTHVGDMAAEFSAADLDAAIRVLSAMSRVHDTTL